MPYILLVDDDADGREPLARLLEHRGYEVHCAPNGHAALQSIMARTPDVIVLDLFMPEMDGVQFLEVLRSYLRLQSLSVVVLTAFPESPLVRQARALGVRQILPKSGATIDQIETAISAELPKTSAPSGGHRAFYYDC